MRRRSSIWSSASDGCRVRKNGCHSIVSIYPYRAHTAEEPVGDGPRERCYGPVNLGLLEGKQTGVGRGLT